MPHSHPCAIVPVEKWVVLRDVKKIRCRHCRDRRMKVFAIESSLWHRECGLQDASVTNSVGTAIPFDLLFMNFEYLVQREEEGIHRLAAVATPPTARRKKFDEAQTFAHRRYSRAFKRIRRRRPSRVELSRQPACGEPGIPITPSRTGGSATGPDASPLSLRLAIHSVGDRDGNLHVHSITARFIPWAQASAAIPRPARHSGSAAPKTAPSAG